MDTETKSQIKKLKKEKKYDEIFYKFGTKEYKKNTPIKIRKQELKKLKAEGKYLDIYNKYGEDEYNKALLKAMYGEIKENKGIVIAILWRTKEKIIETFKQVMVIFSGTLLLGPPTIALVGADYIKDEVAKNQITYSDEIEEYNDKINQYAKEINSMHLDDVQVFMKVMDDMWGSIQGYGIPEKDIIGFEELDLASEDGYGVCRNMASDVAKKLNAINPKYNARTIIVNMGEEGKYTIANIERKTVKEDNNENEEESTVIETENENIVDKLMKKISGNHLVTLVDVPEDNLIIVLDPTNPGIGIYKDGEITMLNADKEEGVKFEAKEYISSFILSGGIDNITDVIGDYAKSFEKSNLTSTEIKEKYGLDAQNNALKEIREKEITKREKFVKSIEINKSTESKDVSQSPNRFLNKNNEISQEENEK